jgi:hypothetical protein
MRVKETVGDPDERRGRAALRRSQAADRALRGDQALPGVVVNLRRQDGLVKIEIAAPQLGPTVAVFRVIVLTTIVTKTTSRFPGRR